MTIRASTVSRSRAMPSSAARRRRVPSKSNGLVTTPTVSAPAARAMLGDDGRGSGAGAAAHAGGDEDHVGAAHHLAEGIGALLGRALADLGPTTGAEPLGQLVADADGDRRLAAHQGLGVGVDRDELDAVDTGVDHPVDGVAAGATDADHLDVGEGLAHHVVPVGVSSAR